MERLSEKIIQDMTENNIFPEGDNEIYAFGLIQMVRVLLNVFTINYYTVLV